MQRIVMALFISMLALGCGEKKEAAPSGVAEEEGCGCGCGCGCGEEESGGAYTADQGTAGIKGVVKWEGTAPRRRTIDMGADKYCVQCHPEGAKSETAIVGPDGGFANVFVYVKSGLQGWTFETPGEPAKLDQIGCTYVPHVMGVMVNQTIEIHNSDSTMHNVHAVDFRTRRDHFNFAQSKKGAMNKQSFRRAGIAYVKCDVHGWMSSYVHVLKHPFFAVTGEDGAFLLDKLPPGTYTIEAWHEKYGTQTQSVTVGDGETGEIAFTFKKG